jgi:hypothetical protein
MPDKSDTPTLDLMKIAFPTDSLTIGELRRLMPNRFSRGNLGRTDLLDIEVGGVLGVEIDLAKRAFYKALGIPEPDPDWEPRAALIDILDDGYKRLGLSTGRNKTRELARAIERAAIEQAEGLKGRRR